MMFLMCSDLAIRSGTAAKLGPDNYNYQRNELSFKTKFNTPQVMPATEELAKIIQQLRKKNPHSNKPFTHQLSRDGHCHYNTLICGLRELRAELGITRRLTFHDLRRTTADNVYKQTGDLRTVQSVLGHRSLKSTLHYLDHRVRPVKVSVLELAKLNPTTEIVQ